MWPCLRWQHNTYLLIITEPVRFHHITLVCFELISIFKKEEYFIIIVLLWPDHRLYIKMDDASSSLLKANLAQKNNTWTNISLIRTTLNDRNIPSTNMEEAGFITYTPANQQGAIKGFWLHFWALLYRASLHTAFSCISKSFIAFLFFLP